MLDQWLLVVALLGLGGAVVLAIHGTRLAFVEVPDEDRTFMDRPPRWYRLAWPLVQLVSFRLGPFLTVAYRHRTQLALRNAGLDYALSPEQFFAGKILGAAGAVALLTVVTWPAGGLSWKWLLAVGVLGFVFPDLWLREERERRQFRILKALPFYLDVITLCVEAGLNLTGAMNQAVTKAPRGPLRDELQRALRDIRTGRPRAESLRALSERLQIPAVSNVVSALIAADKQGSSLGPILRAQAEQRRTERFLRAEKMAMEAPVKMLFPLIAFVFPCTFAVIAFPLVMKFLQEGLLQ